jgi:transcriptional regulator with XRE-family HTH domain
LSRKKSSQLGKYLGIGDRIRKIRSALTQKEFGKLFGVVDSAISKWEKGKLPDEETLKKLADYGGVTVEWLLKGEETPIIQEHAPELYQAQPVELDVDVLTEIIAAARGYLRQHRQSLNDRSEARLIADLYYYWLTEKTMPDYQVIHAYLPLAKRPSS